MPSVWITMHFKRPTPSRVNICILMLLDLLEDVDLVWIVKHFIISITQLHDLVDWHTPQYEIYPLESPFQQCTKHGQLGRRRCKKHLPPLPGASVTLTCVTPMYAWGRYLFVAAGVYGYFHLAEVEVFDGMLTRPFVICSNNNTTITAPWRHVVKRRHRQCRTMPEC